MTSPERSEKGATADLPRRFGRYALFERIGRGGMAEIFLARAKTELGGAKLLVVKEILPALARKPRFADLLINEAKLAARLSHANIVHVTDLGRSDERLFIAMEYVEGIDLAELMRRCARERVPFPVEFGLFVIAETLRGLDYAHRRRGDDQKPLGIVHRDVSPSNILLSFEGEVKLCDFGIAHARDATEKPEDVLQGKAGYMSPEHARGLSVDARSDVFAAGVVLWELLAGTRFYKSEHGESLLDLAKRAPARPLPERGLPYEHELSSIVAQATAVSLDERYASAGAMLRDLESYMARARLPANQLKLGLFLRDTLGTEIVERRRSNERAMRAIEMGPVLVMKPRPSSAPPPSSIAPVGPVSGLAESSSKRGWIVASIAIALLVVVAILLFVRHRAGS